MPPGRSTSKATRSSRSQPPPQAASIPPFQDVGPLIDFIDHLLSIAHDDSDESNKSLGKERSEQDERPAKRSKSDCHVDDPYIPVSRRSLAVTKSSSRRGSVAEEATSRNAIRFFDFVYRENDGLTITARDRRRVNAKVTLTPNELGPLDAKDVLMLKAANKIGPDPPEPGRFWTSVCLEVRLTEGQATLAVNLELRWNTNISVDGSLHLEPQRELRQHMLAAFFPGIPLDRPPDRRGAEQFGSPQDFYEAAHVPSKSEYGEIESMRVPALTANLFPFQRRAVGWLLHREGAQWTTNCGNGNPGVIPYQPPSDQQAFMHFIRTVDADGESCFVSSLFGVVTRDPAVFEANERAIRGGILSEEMGLGKTVETISLILLHRRPPVSTLSPAVSPSATQVPRPIGATLIVTPPALRSQWISELKQHAPGFKVMVYEGMRKSCPDEASEAAMVEKFAVHDVVITTYGDLRSELHFAVEPPQRNLRGERKRPRPRSPLVQLSWWRVCLDEAQEIESGVSNAATIVRVVPRVNAWGVTGTPVKDDIQGKYS
ncbi:snf2 family helicase [Grosmannia clavigera kw1407]|uniref:Snf2 family helicase n=1 Tax=Grosmannia clavigera (strain kw1407 / UAMH 11150) TaxID=655863 RepID=F0XMB1_GROCL|nr:snf2 family helicase [Grosmannia clavigera kw1407]EFX01261.1 snf2 family helicase [Grosmannia clavigera kw1407]